MCVCQCFLFSFYFFSQKRHRKSNNCLGSVIQHLWMNTYTPSSDCKRYFFSKSIQICKKKKKGLWLTWSSTVITIGYNHQNIFFHPPPPPPVKTCIIILRIYLSFFACKSKTFGLKSDLFVCSPTQLHLGWWMRKEFLLVDLTWLFEPPWVTS